VTFANLYFTALRDFVAGDGSIPSAWAPLVEARGRTTSSRSSSRSRNERTHQPRPSGGARRDMHGPRVEPRDASPQHRDFKRIDGVLAETEALVKGRFVTGDLAEVAARSDTSTTASRCGTSNARGRPRGDAQTLWALRGVPLLGAKFLLTLDRMVGFASRGLLCPLVAVKHLPEPRANLWSRFAGWRSVIRPRSSSVRSSSSRRSPSQPCTSFRSQRQRDRRGGPRTIPPWDVRTALEQRFAPVLKLDSKELLLPIDIPTYVSTTSLDQRSARS